MVRVLLLARLAPAPLTAACVESIAMHCLLCLRGRALNQRARGSRTAAVVVSGSASRAGSSVCMTAGDQSSSMDAHSPAGAAAERCEVQAVFKPVTRCRALFKLLELQLNCKVQ